MLSLKMSVAMGILASTVVISSAITYALIHYTLVVEAVDCGRTATQQEALRKFIEKKDIPVNDGERF